MNLRGPAAAALGAAKRGSKTAKGLFSPYLPFRQVL